MLHVKFALLECSGMIVAQRYRKEGADYSSRNKQMLKPRSISYCISEHREVQHPTIIPEIHLPLGNRHACKNTVRSAITQYNVPVFL